jgi:succinyl-CoA synthetase alpha subunit
MVQNKEISVASGFVIRKNQYYDSLFLMGISKRISGAEGVQQNAVLMGSDNNKKLLSNIGIRDTQIDAARPNDLIVAVIAETPQIVNDVLDKLDEYLAEGLQRSSISSVRSFEDGLARKPDANLVAISVPGDYAAREARKALDSGLNVFLFSNNVSIDDELALKKFAKQKNLLVMGPDCGSSLIGAVGIGFANVVRKGPIGVISASGTGLQEFTCQVHNAGFGISHAIGTGSRDLSDKIGGLTTLAALDALEADPQTKVITILSKPPGAKTFAKLSNRLKSCKKPVVGCFLGTPKQIEREKSFQCARLIDDAVRLAIRQIDDKAFPTQLRFTKKEQKWMSRETASWSTEQKYIRGLFAGGTFCYQSQQIFQDAGVPVYSNVPLDPTKKLIDPDLSIEDTIIDMGDDHYTAGRPHPMIDGTLRQQRILAESRDPQVAILLLDFILGYNASMELVGEQIEAIIEAKQQARKLGGALTVVASVCGTDDDPQDPSLQTKMLEESGVIVFPSNAKAANFCCDLIKHRLEG